MQRMAKSAAVLCMLLVLCSSIALVTHQHSDPVEAAKCTVCIAAHSAAPVASFILPNFGAATVVAIPLQESSSQQRLVTFALSVRPPPAV